MAKSDNEKQLDEKEEGTDFTRFMMIGVGAVIFVIFVILLGGIGLAVLFNPDDVAPRIELIRDTLVLAMVLEGVLIVLGLAVLAVQFMRLMVMLQHRSQPVIKNAQETMEIAKGTAQFVSTNVAKPVLGFLAFMSAARTFFSEVGGIRQAIRPSAPDPSDRNKDHA